VVFENTDKFLIVQCCRQAWRDQSIDLELQNLQASACDEKKHQQKQHGLLLTPESVLELIRSRRHTANTDIPL